MRRRWAWPLVPLYGAGLAAKDLLRGAGLGGKLSQQRLRWPVISVGSLSAGGAGKTPATIALARLLRERGWVVDILSRGYGRAGHGIEAVVPGGAEAARRYGDEPVLMAERAGVPVWVGKSRFAAGTAAERAAAGEGGPPPAGYEPPVEPNGGPVPRVHLLDDGMQHRRLHRSFDLVLVTVEDLRDTLLPAGNLREPLRALRRADAFAVREEELDAVSRQLRRFGTTEAPVWTLRRALRFPAPLGVFGAGLRPLAFCGLARPEDFAASLVRAGCGVIDTVIFPDHHRYEEADLQTLQRMAGRLRATGLVTTEKDAVKLSAGMRSRLEAEVGPLVVVALETSFVYEAPVVRALESRLRAPGVAEGALAAQVP